MSRSSTVLTLARKLSWLGVALLAILPASGAASTPDAAFLGPWDLTITAPGRELSSWIEVTQDGGQPAILMVGLSGHATRVKQATTEAGEIRFVATREEQGFGGDVAFKGKLVGRQLQGTATDSSGVVWPWIGVKAPTFDRQKPPAWGKPVPLFNGKDLTGWKLRNETKSGTWKVANGVLTNVGPGSDLVTTSTYGNFKLHIEFNSGTASNSGIYLRGRYEVQVETDSVAEPKSHHTGGVYGFLEPSPEQPRKPGEWQSFDITLVGRTLTVVQNGITVIAGQKIPGITGGALDSHEALPGPICLQGSEPGTVSFRNILMTPEAK